MLTSLDGLRRMSPTPPPLRSPWFMTVTMHIRRVSQARSVLSSSSSSVSGARAHTQTRPPASAPHPTQTPKDTALTFQNLRHQGPRDTVYLFPAARAHECGSSLWHPQGADWRGHRQGHRKVQIPGSVPRITSSRKPFLVLPAPHSVWLQVKGLHALSQLSCTLRAGKGVLHPQICHMGSPCKF